MVSAEARGKGAVPAHWAMCLGNWRWTFPALGENMKERRILPKGTTAEGLSPGAPYAAGGRGGQSFHWADEEARTDGGTRGLHGSCA